MTNESLAVLIQNGNTEYEELLWDKTERFIMCKAADYYRKYQSQCRQKGVDIDDLCQEGYFALVDAVKAFRAETGWKLLSYIKYPLMNRFNVLLGFRGKRQLPTVGLDTQINGDGATLGDVLPDERAGEQLNGVIHEQYIEQLRRDMGVALGTLPGNESTAVRLRYYERAQLQGEQRQALERGIRKIRHNNSIKMYRSDIIDGSAYKPGTVWTSSTERTAIKLIRVF